MLGANLVPAVNSLMTMGNCMEQAGELTASLNNMMSDAEGAITKTAIINLGNKLKNFVPEAKGEDAFGKFAIPEAQRAAYEAARGKGTAAQIEAMQQNPELRRAFFATNTFEAEAQAPIKSWLEGAANAKAQFEAVRQGIKPVDAKMADEFERQIRFYDSGSYQPLADAERESKANEEKADYFDDSARLAMHDARVAVGVSPAESAIGEIRKGMKALSPEYRQYAEAQIRVLERLLAAVEKQTGTIERQGRGGPTAANPPETALGD
jgi:hypothetical protein